jgi:predicted lipase
LPDKASFDDATLDNIKKISNNISWIKDTFKKDVKRCQDECTFESIEEDYAVKVKPGKKLCP